MPSQAFEEWASKAQAAFDEIENAHRAVGGTRPGRRTLTQQINYSYVSLLAARFQGYCRALHSEVVPIVASSVTGDVAIILHELLTRDRKLDRGNANPGNLGADFNRFGLDFWKEVEARDSRNARRKASLQDLVDWRNAIQHHDIDAKLAAGELTPNRITLGQCQRWRRSLMELAKSVDAVLADQCESFGRPPLW